MDKKWHACLGINSQPLPKLWIIDSLPMGLEKNMKKHIEVVWGIFKTLTRNLNFFSNCCPFNPFQSWIFCLALRASSQESQAAHLTTQLQDGFF